MKVLNVSGIIDTVRDYRHEARPSDYNLAFALILSTALIISTPLNPASRLIRQAVAGPLIVLGWLYLAWVPYVRNDAEQWGVTILSMAHAFRSLEMLICFPPEENVHRIRQVRKERLEPSSQPYEGIELEAEPVPEPFTLAKFYWGMSLFWSWRGIGWNFECPLPASSRRQPFNRNSTRKDFFKTRLRQTLTIWFCWDLFRTYTNLTSASIYLNGKPEIAPLYSSLSIWEKAIHSTIIPARIVIDTDRSYVMASILMVGLGGLMRWEGEIWSPWGWPPLFGTFGDLWTTPGLATMWSKTWQGYFRRWLHVLGWIGIGENIFGLTHSGESAHPDPKSESTSREPLLQSATPSPITSGRNSPSHFVPPTATTRSPRQMSTRLALSNFLKSLIVFTLSGLVHDCGTLTLVLLNTPRSQPLNLDRVLALTPFFVLQPFALVFEALLKAQYRKWKAARWPNWRTEGTRPHLLFTERLVGFTLTWIWLGWSAGWFVEGLTKHGMFDRTGDVRLFPSLLGGMFWGKWFH